VQLNAGHPQAQQATEKHPVARLLKDSTVRYMPQSTIGSPALCALQSNRVSSQSINQAYQHDSQTYKLRYEAVSSCQSLWVTHRQSCTVAAVVPNKRIPLAINVKASKSGAQFSYD